MLVAMVMMASGSRGPGCGRQLGMELLNIELPSGIVQNQACCNSQRHHWPCRHAARPGDLVGLAPARSLSRSMLSQLDQAYGQRIGEIDIPQALATESGQGSMISRQAATVMPA